MGATDLPVLCHVRLAAEDPTSGVNHHPLLWVSWEQGSIGSPVSIWAGGKVFIFQIYFHSWSSGGLAAHHYQWLWATTACPITVKSGNHLNHQRQDEHCYEEMKIIITPSHRLSEKVPQGPISSFRTQATKAMPAGRPTPAFCPEPCRATDSLSQRTPGPEGAGTDTAPESPARAPRPPFGRAGRDPTRGRNRRGVGRA